jgi:hypothetical protein
MASSEKVHYSLFPIVGTVNERGLILHVREQHIREELVLTAGTTLTNFMSALDIPKGDAIDMGYGDYIYREQIGKEGNNLRFIFLKAKTEEQEITPVKEPSTINEVTWWPNWLVSLYALQATVPLQSEAGTDSGGTTNTNTVTGTRYFDRYILIPGGDFNTQHIVEEFFSYRPIPGLVATEPRPTTVKYSTLGMQNSIDCLHDEVKIPELILSSSLVEDFGTPNAREVKWELGSIYPATNMPGWAPHFRKLEVAERDGGFFYRRHLVIPPNPFKPLEI